MAVKFKDYYAIIGVPEDASAEEIKKAYRALARKHHPDLNKDEDAEERFKELGEAYEVLKDPAKREEYDQIRKYGASAGNSSSSIPRLCTLPPVRECCPKGLRGDVGGNGKPPGLCAI